MFPAAKLSRKFSSERIVTDRIDSKQVSVRRHDKLKVKIAFFQEKDVKFLLTFVLAEILKGKRAEAANFLPVSEERYFYKRTEYTLLAVSSFGISTETHFHFLRKLHAEYVMHPYWISWKRNVAGNVNVRERAMPLLPLWDVSHFFHETFFIDLLSLPQK